MAGDYEDLRAKRSASETAQTFLRDVNRQVEIGSVGADRCHRRADRTVATTAQAVVDSDAALRQEELSLKNLISRTGAADPVLANVRIMPIDSIEIPPSRRSASISQMVQQALANRADLAAELAGEKANEVNSLGTKNGILPTLQGSRCDEPGRIGGSSENGHGRRVHRTIGARFPGRHGDCSRARFSSAILQPRWLPSSIRSRSATGRPKPITPSIC